MNLKIINKFVFYNTILFFFILLNFKIVNSLENRIIFKINDQVFTLFDLEKRKEYLDFVGSSKEIDDSIVLNDFVSANIFFEYYKNTNNEINYSNKLEEIYSNILAANNQNNKIYKYEINKELILENIKIDFIRKIILENILNSSISKINTSNEEIDLLYNFKIKYINFEIKDINSFKKKIENLGLYNYEFFIDYLKNNNINFFVKEKEINNINEIDKTIKNNILSNRNFFIIEKKNNISVIFIKKSFETFEAILANLYSVKSKKILNNEFLNCQNLIKLKDDPNIINKEYKLIDLNNELKSNLVNINDYVKYESDNEIVYIVLCNIKFDKEILKNINQNKFINFNITEIESKFINKYSKIYNLIMINE